MIDFNVREFGAVGDGVHLDTPAIQAAVDACHRAGGGAVVFPPGGYHSGSILMRSGVVLRLGQGAVLLGSQEINDYTSDVVSFNDGVGVERGRALIYSHQLENVGIEGPGTIDGRGGIFKGIRPMLLRFVECRDVRVWDVRLRDSGAWVQHYLRCDNVHVRGVHVNSYCNSNNDGINVDGCHRVRISDCHFDSFDDALTLKSTSPRACRDIVISNCLLKSFCNGLKFGTESVGGFEDVAVSNCVVLETRHSGLTIACVDGGKLRNVTISNLIMREVGCAFFVRLGQRCYHLDASVTERPLGELRGLTIQNLHAETNNPIGASILGLPESAVQDVTVSGVTVTNPGGGTKAQGEQEIPEKRADYPEYNRWGMMPAHGLYCRHVRGLRLYNCRFGVATPDSRPALGCEDVERLIVRDFYGHTAPDADALIRLRGVPDPVIDNAVPSASVPVLRTL